ncbi:thermonuclease family protein [Staphylospora marina]|uniref:thermonuclease family protein n=1 Tax=Staphylospora marina TaxID=2490858 RepID=UPI0013DDC050|nr:thermonuclease family protein [Staphylospora marina]
MDGDTLKVDISGRTEKIRFLLVDTLEVGSVHLLEHFLALKAKKYVSNAVRNARTVEVATSFHRDRFGRLLGHVFVDGRCLQEILVKKGLARVAYVKKQALTQEDRNWLGRFRRKQEEARRNRRGIWEFEHKNGQMDLQVRHVGR